MKLKMKDIEDLSPNHFITAVLQEYDYTFPQIHANDFGAVDYTQGGRAYTRAFEILAMRRDQLDHEVNVLSRAYKALRQEAGEE